MLRLRHALRAEILDDAGEKLRRRGQVKEPLAANVLLPVDAVELGLQACVVGRVVEVEREVADVLHKVVELGVARVNAAELEDSRTHVGRKLVTQRPPRNAHDCELRGQQVRLAQMKQGRQKLALGQVAGGAEDYQNPRIGNPLLPLWDLGKILGPHACLYRRHFFLLEFSAFSSRLPASSWSFQSFPARAFRNPNDATG